MLEPDELAEIRADLEATLPATVTVERATETVTAGGGYAEALTVVGTHPARIEPHRAPRPELAGDKRVVVVLWDVLLPYGADVRPGDVIVDPDGLRFNVVETDAGSTDAFLLTASCQRGE